MSRRPTPGPLLRLLLIASGLASCDLSDDALRVRIDRGHAPVETSAATRASADVGPVGTPDAVADAAQLDDAPEPPPADAAAPEDIAAPEVSAPDVPEPPPEGACRVGDRLGRCLPLDQCADGEVEVEGFCDGAPIVRCCLEALDRCSAKRLPGACLPVAACTAADFTTTSGLCPGPSDVRCCHPASGTFDCGDGDAPVPIAAAPEAPGDPGCPPGMALVGPFCIDRFEAALVRADDPAVTLTPFARPAAATPIRAVSVRHVVPQGYIDGESAKRACLAAGKRLCTSDEWLLACRGAEGRIYPYGNTRENGRCNDDRGQHAAIEYFGSSEAWVWSRIGHPCISQLPDTVHLTGEDAGCVTPEGVFDLMGNLHEWIDDPAGTFRGGFFDDTRVNGEGCLYRTVAHDVSHWDYSTGFRCCVDASP
jgi:sulfatase modifying factor 1